MRPGTPDSGQAAKRDSLWVLDIGSSNHGGRAFFVHTHIILARLRPLEANTCSGAKNPRLTMPSRRSRRYWPRRTCDAPESGLFIRRPSRFRQQRDLLIRAKRAVMN
jgi:hypothetical protein